MKIHVVGAGVVGKATGEGFKRYGHQVVYSDKGDNLDVEADLHLICTPEDTVPLVLVELYRGISDPALVRAPVVIRSSVPPGTTEELARQYPRLNLFHNPEFLREAMAESDFLHADRAIIGWGNRGRPFCHPLEDLYAQLGVPVHRCPSTMSEMVKLVTNSYLATQLGFWQNIKWLCEAMRLNSHELGALVALDSRVSSYGPKMHGTSYGHTKCLPKDLAQLIDVGLRAGVDVSLLHAVKLVDLMAFAKEKACESSS